MSRARATKSRTRITCLRLVSARSQVLSLSVCSRFNHGHGSHSRVIRHMHGLRVDVSACPAISYSRSSLVAVLAGRTLASSAFLEARGVYTRLITRLLSPRFSVETKEATLCLTDTVYETAVYLDIAPGLCATNYFGAAGRSSLRGQAESWGPFGLCDRLGSRTTGPHLPPDLSLDSRHNLPVLC